MNQTNAQHKQGKTILVIEDEPVITRICVRILTAEGFTVDIASNGNIAKDMIHKKDYDLCLSDIRTPEMNGIEFYRYLEEKRDQLVDKVLFTTGDILSDEIKAFLSEVKRPFMAKPFTPKDLRKAVMEAIK